MNLDDVEGDGGDEDGDDDDGDENGDDDEDGDDDFTWEETLKHLGLANFLSLMPLQPLQPDHNFDAFCDGDSDDGYYRSVDSNVWVFTHLTHSW